MIELPQWVEQVLDRYWSAEVTTLAPGGPVTFPMFAFYEKETGRIIITSSVAFPQKVFNLKRTPFISLLYSYPVGSGIEENHVVLVQGETRVLDEDFEANFKIFLSLLPRWKEREPWIMAVLNSSLWRRLYRYYLTRVIVEVYPVRIMAWEKGILSRPPLIIEVPVEEEHWPPAYD